MAKQILVVDDDPHIREVVAFAVEKAGMGVVQAADGRQALEMAAKHMPDLLVLDISMPELDGLEVCRTLRKSSDVPILFLSSRDEEIDRIIGLELGGDDYVTKPFSPRELVARINAILKRRAAPPASSSDTPQKMSHGKVTIDPASYTALCDGKTVALTATEFMLLLALFRSHDRVFTRDELMDRAYGDITVADRTIDSHIRRVRQKFALHEIHDVIETVHGIGYKLGDLRVKKRFTIGLQAVFAVILLIVLLLPLSGVYFFRLFENELVRQTEAELIAQGVFMSALYKDALNGENIAEDYGRPVTEKPPVLDARFKPYPPTIDLRTAPILPPRPDAVHPAHKPDPAALTAGRRLESVLQEAKFSTLASMRMLDFDGTVVAGAGEMNLSLAHTEEVARAMTGLYTSALRQRISDEPRPALASLSRGTDTRVFVAMPVVDNDRVLGIAYLSRSPRNVLKTLYDERESVFLAAVIALLMTGGIAWVLATLIGKPLRVLTRHAQAVSKGEARQDALPAPPIRELAALTDSFAHMSATIEARSEYIRSFAMHVAHEFKTPLTAIQGAVELLNDHANDMEPEQRRRFMENITQDTGRLKILVSRLLELARADVLQAGGEFTDMSPLLALLEKRYAPRVAVTHPEGPWLAAIGPDILETVLVNLIENSLQHGATRVYIAAESWEHKMELTVRDNGQGISAGNAAKLFTPFFTTRREQGGTGLGLVITRSLLKAYGGDIALIGREAGTTFKITLKGY